MLRSVLSISRCRFQNLLFSSSTAAQGDWQCRWWNIWPLRLATTAHPAKGASNAAWVVPIASGSEIPGVSTPASKAFSEQGKLIKTCFRVSTELQVKNKWKMRTYSKSRSSIINGHPVPTPAYLSIQNANQNALLLSSFSPTHPHLSQFVWCQGVEGVYCDFLASTRLGDSKGTQCRTQLVQDYSSVDASQTGRTIPKKNRKIQMKCFNGASKFLRGLQ